VAVGRTLRQALSAVHIRQELELLSAPDPRGFQVVALDTPLAFTLGFVSPAAYLSSGLLRQLDPASAASALAHERSHVRHADPLASDQQSTGLPAGSCDTIFLRGSYHHLTQPHQTLQSLEREVAAAGFEGARRLERWPSGANLLVPHYGLAFVRP
jgi:hypothetical protein